MVSSASFRLVVPLVASLLISCNSGAQTALDHPLPPAYRRALEEELATASTASLKEKICAPNGLFYKRALIEALTSRVDDPETLPALREALHRCDGKDIFESSLRGELRVAIAKVEARGVREREIAGLSTLLEPDNEAGTIDAAAWALQRLGGDDSAASLRKRDEGRPIIRLARYHIELDPLPAGEAVRRILIEAKRRLEIDEKDTLVPEGSYLAARGRSALPSLHEAVGTGAQKAVQQSAYMKFVAGITEVISLLQCGQPVAVHDGLVDRQSVPTTLPSSMPAETRP